MKSLHKKLGVLAVAGAMAAGVAGNAQAGVLAQSVLEISNFQFLNSPEGSPVSASQFDTLDFQDSSLITANLNGVIASHLEQSTTLGTLNNPQQCVGNCAFVENDYTHHYLPTVNVARGDSLLRGAPITTPGAAGTF